MITREQILTVFKLYPSVVTMQGDVAYDKDDNQVVYDLDAVNVKAEELKVAAEAEQEAETAAKQSALSKLSALGLTDAEIKALTGN